MDGRTQVTRARDQSRKGVTRVAALVGLDGGATVRAGRRDTNWIREYGAVVDRLDRLNRPRAVLQALAQDAARLRREAARLRSEKSALASRLSEVEARINSSQAVTRTPR